MLSSSHRLRRSADFQRVVRRGHRASSPTVVVHSTAAASPHEPALVGFVVSKSVGNAVVRNLVKRRLREAVRSRLSTMDGQLFVVRAKSASAGANFRQLSADLDRCLTSTAARAEETRARR